jgi:hypothetical protein
MYIPTVIPGDPALDAGEVKGTQFAQLPRRKKLPRTSLLLRHRKLPQPLGPLDLAFAQRALTLAGDDSVGASPVAVFEKNVPGAIFPTCFRAGWVDPRKEKSARVDLRIRTNRLWLPFYPTIRTRQFGKFSSCPAITQARVRVRLLSCVVHSTLIHGHELQFLRISANPSPASDESRDTNYKSRAILCDRSR